MIHFMDDLSSKKFQHTGRLFDTVGVAFAVLVLPIKFIQFLSDDPNAVARPIFFQELLWVELLTFTVVTFYLSVRSPKFDSEESYRRFLTSYILTLLLNICIVFI